MARKTLKSVAYVAIRDAILAGQLRPNTPLSEAQLEEMLGVSRTPIREALQRLADENLISLTPHKGAIVTSVSIDDCQDIFRIRESLEGLAAALCATRMPSEQMESLKLEYDRLAAQAPDEKRMVAFGKALHSALQESNGSRRLIRLLRLLRQEHDRVGLFQLQASGRIRDAFAEHGEILAALQRREPSTAEAAMRRHVRRSADTAIQLMLSAPYRATGLSVDGDLPAREQTGMAAPA